MGMINNIRDFLLRTSGLSPVNGYVPVAANDFISSYNKKIPLRTSKLDRIKDVMDNAFQNGFEALKKAGAVPEKILSTVNRIGLSVNRLMMPNGQTVSVISDNKGRTVAAAKAGITDNIAKKVAPSDMTPMQEQAMAATKRFAYRLRNEPGSMESAALSEFVKPFKEDGRVKGMAKYGWDGLRQNIRSLAIPKEYERSGALMDMTIRGNSTYIGISMMSAGPRRDDTLKAMLNHALDMDMHIPPRKDGKPWNIECPIDKEMADALYRQKDSPFVVGGKPEMIEGSAILLNNANLLRLNAIAPELSPANLDKTMGAISQRLETQYSEQFRDAASPKERKEATAKLESLKNNRNFMTYENMSMSFHLEQNEKRQKEELKKFQDMAAKRARNPQLYEAMDSIFEDDPAIPKIAPLTYEEIKRRDPTWEPGPEHVSIEMDGSLPSVKIKIDHNTQKKLGLWSKDGVVNDMSGFNITDLKPGIYPVDGAKDAFIKIAADENGQRECLTTGLDTPEAPEMEGPIQKKEKKQTMSMA